MYIFISHARVYKPIIVDKIISNPFAFAMLFLMFFSKWILL